MFEQFQVNEMYFHLHLNTVLKYNCRILLGKKWIPSLTLIKNPVCEPSEDAIL